MDQTGQVAQMFAELRAAATPEAIEAQHAAGVSAAKAAITSKETFLLMDEAGFNQLQNAYAIGWNATWIATQQPHA